MELQLYKLDAFGDDPMRSICTDVVFRKMTQADMGVLHPSVLTLHHDRAQALMDQLWYCGLRPTEGIGSAGALAATQAHLKDLQHLVFKTKPKE